MDTGVRDYYLREDVQELILACAKNREIAVKFDFGFGKRPDVLMYKSDIADFARQGALSFHCSEELWKNPLQLQPSMTKKDLDNLRIGWDLVLDIDCPYLEYSQIAADLLVKALRSKGIKNISVKFSGNHGFHIGVPFEAFPSDMKDFFPDGVRMIARYLQGMISQFLTEKIMEKETAEQIMEKTGKKIGEITKKEKGMNVFDPFKLLAIDSVLISSRHMFRMPYSINEKSYLVSLPIDPDKILEFKKEMADPQKLKKVSMKFLDREKVVPNEAKELFDSASEMFSEIKRNEEIKDIIAGKKQKIDYEDMKAPLPEELFPPCIKKGLEGMQDGKKRFVFALINFLTMSGWHYDKIGEFIREWNKKNPEPLRDNYWITQFNYHKQNKKRILPPNCKEFYHSMGLCFPDNICNKIKNPVSYGRVRMRKV
jgi:hypothetical protein